jgi:hypothetical protein
MRQHAAVSGFRINELNAAAPVLLTMTLTGALGAKKAPSGPGPMNEPQKYRVQIRQYPHAGGTTWRWWLFDQRGGTI